MDKIKIQEIFEAVFDQEFIPEHVEDPHALYIDYTEDFDETGICERLVKKKVIRKGKKLIKWKTDKDGYRVQMIKGRPKEVRMDAKEKLTRKKSAKKTARKNKSKKAQMSRSRSKSLKKKKSLGL